MNEREKTEWKTAWLKVIAISIAAMIFFIVALPYLNAVPFLLPLLLVAAVVYTLIFLKKMLDRIAPPDMAPHPDLTPDDRRLD